jgi:HPt (histidine-containing phosphotransfer) domain-containing protein
VSDEELLRTLAALRAQYVAEAPARIEALRDATRRIAGGDRGAVGELRHLLHKLAGSGGAYGLQAVTDSARVGELRAHELEATNAPPSPDDAARLAELVEAVASAFRDAGGQT